MRHTFFRTMGIAAVSAAMIMGTAMPAFAVDAPTTSTRLTVKKALNKDADDYVPNETYTFQIAEGAADAAKAVIAGPVNAVRVNDAELGENGTFAIQAAPDSADIGKTSVAIGSAAVTFDTRMFTKPGIYRYTIDELGTDNQDEDYDDSVYTMDVYFTNDGAISNVVAYTETSEKAAEITFTNSIAGDGEKAHDDLTVLKRVEGNMGEKDRAFNFTVALKEGNGSYRLTVGNSSHTLSKEAPSVNLTLKDGESFTVYGLDSAARISAVEENLAGEGYKTVYYSNYEQKTQETGLTSDNGKAITAKTTITVENEKETDITTGIVREYTPFILMVVLAGAVAVVFFRRKKA
jgi:pilin isopeptide linkage protein